MCEEETHKKATVQFKIAMHACTQDPTLIVSKRHNIHKCNTGRKFCIWTHAISTWLRDLMNDLLG